MPIRVPSDEWSAIPRAPTMLAIGARTRAATSCSLVAAISPPIASCMRVCSGRRQSRRRLAGGAKPSRNATPLNVPSSATASEPSDPSSPTARDKTSAAVSTVDANASICILLRATDASSRPARQRRMATMLSSNDQCTRKATT